MSPHSSSCLLQSIRSFHATIHPISTVLSLLPNTWVERHATLYLELIGQLGLIQLYILKPQQGQEKNSLSGGVIYLKSLFFTWSLSNGLIFNIKRIKKKRAPFSSKSKLFQESSSIKILEFYVLLGKYTYLLPLTEK